MKVSLWQVQFQFTQLIILFIICCGHFCSFFLVLLPKIAESLLCFHVTLHSCTSREGLSIKHVHLNNLLPYTGLLIFRAVADLRNSGISAKFPQKREIRRNLQEIFPNTCRQNILILILILAIRPV